jgi:hypothetical protein
MKQFLATWDASRILRLVLAIALGMYAWNEANGMMGILAAWLGTQAVFNIGCCGSQGCHVPFENRTKNEAQKITYEEITADKKP